MYLYFDCFAGFDIFMALGAMIDMTKEPGKMQPICESLFPKALFSHREVKRASMEAQKAEIEAGFDKSFNLSELIEYIESSSVEPRVKEKLCSFSKIIASARSVCPDDATFDMNSFSPVLCAAACIFSTVQSEKIKNVWISKPLISNSYTFTPNGFECITKPETVYILKKYKIDTAPTDFPKELFTEDGAALLACLNAKNTDYSFGNSLKIGYGAGDSDPEGLINILRVVVGRDDETDILNFECKFEESFQFQLTNANYCKKD